MNGEPRKDDVVSELPPAVIDVLRIARDGLEAEVRKRNENPPNVTDDKSAITEAVIDASTLAGKRLMLEQIEAGLGLTKKT